MMTLAQNTVYSALSAGKLGKETGLLEKPSGLQFSLPKTNSMRKSKGCRASTHRWIQSRIECTERQNNGSKGLWSFVTVKFWTRSNERKRCTRMPNTMQGEKFSLFLRKTTLSYSKISRSTSKEFFLIVWVSVDSKPVGSASTASTIEGCLSK